jgi:hypothetical protein
MKRQRPNRNRPQRVSTETGMLRRLMAKGISKATHRAAYSAAREAYKPGQSLEDFQAALRGSKSASPWLAILLQLAPMFFELFKKLFPAPETPAAA